MVDRPALEGLRGKYAEMLRLREADLDGSLPDPRPAMRALAERFPGALREIDRLPMATIRERIAELDAVLTGAREPAAWMVALARYHAELRRALRVRRALPGERSLAAAREALGAEAMDEGALAAIVRPPEGRLNRVIFAQVAEELGVEASWIESLLSPEGRGPRGRRRGQDQGG